MSTGGSRIAGLVAAALVAGLTLWGLSLVFQPLPVPALTALVGGLLGHWLARTGRPAKILAGLVLGSIPGALLHGYMHYAEGRMHPEEGLIAHIGVDAAGGLALAGLTLGVAIGLSGVIVGRGAHERGDG